MDPLLANAAVVLQVVAEQALVTGLGLASAGEQTPAMLANQIPRRSTISKDSPLKASPEKRSSKQRNSNIPGSVATPRKECKRKGQVTHETSRQAEKQAALTTKKAARKNSENFDRNFDISGNSELFDFGGSRPFSAS